MPHGSISFIYQIQSCQHILIADDDSSPPSIPALTAKGFVRWQAIQTLLDPPTHVPVIQYALRNWNLKHPEHGTPFPVDLPANAFPTETDADTDAWYFNCATRLREQASRAQEFIAFQNHLASPTQQQTRRDSPYPMPRTVRRTPTTPIPPKRSGSRLRDNYNAPESPSMARPRRTTSRPGSRPSSRHSAHELRSHRSRNFDDGPQQSRQSRESSRERSGKGRWGRAFHGSDDENKLGNKDYSKYDGSTAGNSRSTTYDAVWRPRRMSGPIAAPEPPISPMEDVKGKGVDGPWAERRLSL